MPLDLPEQPKSPSDGVVADLSSQHKDSSAARDISTVRDMTMRPKSNDCTSADLIFLELDISTIPLPRTPARNSVCRDAHTPLKDISLRKGRATSRADEVEELPTRSKSISQMIMEAQALELIQLPPVWWAETVDSDDSAARGI
ncbi:hypothetical protein MTO96_016658 [Rhipicephalus appendiculatus]